MTSGWLWVRYYLECPDEFWPSYFVRNLSESGFSAVKSLFTAPLLSRSFEGLVNEGLCKATAYNLIVLARDARMREIDPDLPAVAAVLGDCISDVIEMRKPQHLALVA